MSGPLGADAPWLDSLSRTGFFRGGAGSATSTEWLHVIVRHPELLFLVNWGQHGDGGGRPVPTLLLAAATPAWTAVVERFPADGAFHRPGSLGSSMGWNRLRTTERGLELDLCSADRAIAGTLRLRPEAAPLFAPRQRLGDHGQLSWFAVPRLRAWGEVEVEGRRLRLDGVPAYHDHNWGSFDWGGDLAWDWMVSLGRPDQPWTVLAWRLLDRARHRVLSQAVWLWRGAELAATWRNHDVGVETAGFVRGGPGPVVPVELSSAEPGASTGVPERMEWRATRGLDRIAVSFRSGAVLRVVAPGPHGGDASLLHETDGLLRVEGRVGGERVELEAPGVLEVANG